MVEPTGVENKIERIIPTAAQITEINAEHRMTPRKLLNTRIADRAGKIINAEISSGIALDLRILPCSQQ